MSYRQCNYCVFELIKSEAIKENKIVEIVNGNVYVHSKNEVLDTRSPDDGNKQWQCWLMEIPNSCCC